MVKSPRTQRSDKKTTNMFSKNLLTGKLKNPKEQKKKMNIFSGKEKKEWTEETVVGTLALGRASASRWR